jgi:hypothetical protein
MYILTYNNCSISVYSDNNNNKYVYDPKYKNRINYIHINIISICLNVDNDNLSNITVTRLDIKNNNLLMSKQRVRDDNNNEL